MERHSRSRTPAPRPVVARVVGQVVPCTATRRGSNAHGRQVTVTARLPDDLEVACLQIFFNNHRHTETIASRESSSTRRVESSVTFQQSVSPWPQRSTVASQQTTGPHTQMQPLTDDTLPWTDSVVHNPLAALPQAQFQHDDPPSLCQHCRGRGCHICDFAGVNNEYPIDPNEAIDVGDCSVSEPEHEMRSDQAVAKQDEVTPGQPDVVDVPPDQAVAEQVALTPGQPDVVDVPTRQPEAAAASLDFSGLETLPPNTCRLLGHFESQP